jgi:small subunit ribosomal protein S2
MAPYIFGKRNSIHIIDLRQTVRGLIRGRRFLSRVAAQGDPVLFVGTKRQAAAVLRDELSPRAIPYVADRWLGGMLTNFQTVRRSLGRLEELERLEETGEIKSFSKKMISMLQREKRKILRNLEGVRTLNRLPAAMVVVDPRRDKIAIREAVKLHIPIVALMDTDCDPQYIDIPVPCNDDSIRSIQVVIEPLIEAVDQGTKAAGADTAAPKAKPAPEPQPEPDPEPAMPPEGDAPGPTES